MKKKILIVLALFFFISLTSASFGYDNPTLPNIEEEQIITYRNITNLNSSNYWDALDTPADILGSLINNDLGWIINTVNNLVNYYTKTEINNSFVPYTGAVSNVDLGAHNFTVGTDTLFVDSNLGRVGIGTATPNYKLDVNGTIGTTGSFIDFRSNSASFGYVFRESSGTGALSSYLSMWINEDPMWAGFRTGQTASATPPLVVTSSRVGILDISPDFALDVEGTFAAELRGCSDGETVKWATGGELYCD